MTACGYQAAVTQGARIPAFQNPQIATDTHRLPWKTVTHAPGIVGFAAKSISLPSGPRCLTGHALATPMPGPRFAACRPFCCTGDGLGCEPGATEGGELGQGIQGVLEIWFSGGVESAFPGSGRNRLDGANVAKHLFGD
jgi:hypothetical protein